MDRDKNQFLAMPQYDMNKPKITINLQFFKF